MHKKIFMQIKSLVLKYDNVVYASLRNGMPK